MESTKYEVFEWSPEQINGYAKRHNLFTISHECIYQYILKDKQKGGYINIYAIKMRYRKRYGLHLLNLPSIKPERVT